MGNETTTSSYKERLEKLAVGEDFLLSETDNSQSVYSAIRDNFETFKGKTFKVKTHPVTEKKHVYRTK